ncbi:MAG TPA: hypothetical protein VJR02_19560 [Pyrinomonadaceae bacterium]|nr:hypothetical protein [Pyrinomonadaceae bacterium]
MSICTEKPWPNMKLVKIDDPSVEETFEFSNLTIVNEIITGTVYDVKRNFTDLRGTCSPFDSREDVARMSFFFRARRKSEYVDIVLMGLSYQKDGSAPAFRGGFVVLKALDQTTSEVEVGFDVGDTGTGTGMQAQ